MSRINLCMRKLLVGGKEGEKKEEIGKGKQQLVESRRRLYRVKLRTDQDASSVRVGGDERENAHRTAEELARQVRHTHHGSIHLFSQAAAKEQEMRHREWCSAATRGLDPES